MSLLRANGGGLGGAGAPGGALGSFYSHLLDQSLKFDDNSNTYLTRTPASAGNRKTFTYSSWVKRGKVNQGGSDNPTWGMTAGTKNNSSVDRTEMRFTPTDTIAVSFNTGSTWYECHTNAKFRDTSAWYHFVVAVDMTQSTASNRLKFYVNGVLQTFSAYSVAAQNTDLPINNTIQHAIGEYVAGESTASYQFDGYLAEINFIDGTALTADSFGETKNGIWIPKDTSGLTFGTNGFHLTFKDDVISEGFNTVTWRGTGASNSVSGIGFSPAFVWIKDRTDATVHYLHDVCRGAGKEWYSNGSYTEYSDAQTLKSFDGDGFTVGTSTGVNGSADDVVAWCWEGGGAPTADNSASAGATPTANSVKIDGSNLGSALAGSIAATRLTADTTKGFSAVTYTGTGSAGTVAHGLGAAPKWIIVKRLNATDMALVYHTSRGASAYLYLGNNGSGETGVSYPWNGTDPTTSVFSVNSAASVSSAPYIAYCWAEVSGYSKFGSFTGNGGSQAIDVGFEPAFVMLRRTNGGTWGMFDNTRQSQSLQMIGANSTAAETTNSGMTFSGNTFNDNGYLSDNGATVLYMAFADTREAAFFKDVTTNGNHFRPVNLDYRNSVPDVPTNNFATLNALDNDSMTLSNGNLTGVSGANAHNGVGCTFGVTGGKWYWEVLSGGTGSNFFFGMGYSSFQFISQYTNDAYNLGDFWAVGTDGTKFGDSAADSAGELSYGSALSSGDILQLAFDLDNGKFYAGKNGTYFASGDPAAGSNPAFTTVPTDKQMQPFYGSSTSPVTHTFNFGQDSSFGGLVATENSNSDDNGHGSFAYAPPSGFLALCSQNLPDVAITDGTDNFNTVLYQSNGGLNAITGVGFSPDLLWIKQRDSTNSHAWTDSVRGTTKALTSNASSSEYTYTNGLQSFDSDGFTLNGNNGWYNSTTTRNYVAWNWLAGGAAPAQTYAVTVASDSGQNKYRFDGNTTFAPTLNLQEGGTYTFDQSDSSNSGHPLRFSTTSNGTHASGSEYTTGVTTTGTPGNAGAKTVITVAASAATLYYYCSSHSGMGGQANTNATFGSTNLNGSVLSTVSANTEAGFSIVNYVGNNATGATVAHGLSSAPEMIIVKDRDTDGYNWHVYHAALGATKEIKLNLTNAAAAAAFWNNTAPTSSVFTVNGGGWEVNTNTKNHIAYCFHSVEGYSKVGSFVGNGNADGPFVYTGFRPAFVIVKNSTGTESWGMGDSTRSTFNALKDRLYPDLSNAEYSTGDWLDLVSNGFKHRGTAFNTSGATYIYLAFAESPFKFANAR